MGREQELVLFFDLDGTVLDVSARHHRIYERVTRAFGGTPLAKYDYWQLKQQKLPWPDMLAKSGVPAESLDEFMHMFIAEIEKPEELAQDQPIAGAPDVLEQLHNDSYEMYLVSLRRGHEKFLRQLAQLGIAQYFTDTLSGHTDGPTDELKASIIKSKLAGRRGLIVGDTEADVQAGKRLGMVTVAVCSGIRSRDYLESLQPDYVRPDITSLPDIVAAL